MAHAHEIVNRPAEIPELRGTVKKNHRLISGRVTCQLVKFPQGFRIFEHRHAGAIVWKFLLSGRIRYDAEHSDGGQVLTEGSIATVRRSAPMYTGVVEDEACLLLIEHESSQIVRPSAHPSEWAQLWRSIRQFLLNPLSALGHRLVRISHAWQAVTFCSGLHICIFLGGLPMVA